MKHRIVEVRNVSNTRLWVIAALFAAMLVTLACGLAFRQVVMKDYYDKLQERQNHRRILQSAPRGNIYDRHGKLLVGNRSLFSAVVYLNELRPEFRKAYIECVRQAREDLEKLPEDRRENARIDRNELQWQARERVVQKYLDEANRITGRDEALNQRQFRKHYRENLVLPYPLLSDLTGEQYARLTAQVSPESPLQVYTEHARYYPYGALGFHVLGYASRTTEMPNEEMPGDNLRTYAFKGSTGRSGIEYMFDSRLSGQNGGEIWMVDPSGFQYELVNRQVPKQGEPLTTSLDLEIQKIAEHALEGRKGAVVAIEVQTGEILACASSPTHDLNELSPSFSQRLFDEISEKGAWINRAVNGVYPPGSTFKVVTALAGVRSGEVDEHTLSDCIGYYRVGSRVFKCNRHWGHGLINLVDALAKSCNVFFYEAGVRVGIDKLAAEARRFGLDKKTGIGLMEESSYMIVPDPAWKRRTQNGEGWATGDTVNVSIGQGFLRLTPLQMACFAASFARGETRTQPTLIHDATRDASHIDHGAQPIGLPPDKYQLILDGMERSAENGTSRLAKIPNVRMAGKTGTAQVRVDGVPLTLAWFMGFAPVENPQIAVIVMIEGVDPSDAYQGGTTAAPVGGALIRQYLGIPQSGSIR